MNWIFCLTSLALVFSVPNGRQFHWWLWIQIRLSICIPSFLMHSVLCFLKSKMSTVLHVWGWPIFSQTRGTGLKGHVRCPQPHAGRPERRERTKTPTMKKKKDSCFIQKIRSKNFFLFVISFRWIHLWLQVKWTCSTLFSSWGDQFVWCTLFLWSLGAIRQTCNKLRGTIRAFCCLVDFFLKFQRLERFNRSYETHYVFFPSSHAPWLDQRDTEFWSRLHQRRAKAFFCQGNDCGEYPWHSMVWALCCVVQTSPSWWILRPRRKVYPNRHWMLFLWVRWGEIRVWHEPRYKL